MTLADVGFWSLEAGGFLWIAVTIVWICGIVDLMTKRADLDGRSSRLDPDHRFVPGDRDAGLLFRPTLPAEREQMIAAQQSLKGDPRGSGKVPPVA